MGDPSHITELIDQILEETTDQPELQQKVFDLRDALLQAQQTAQQYALKIRTLEETIQKLKQPAHRIGTIIGEGLDDLYRLNVGGTEYQAAASPEILEEGPLKVGDIVAVNEAFVAIQKLPKPEMGPVGRIASRLADGQWMIAGGTGNAESMVKPADDFDTEGLREGDEVILDPTQKVMVARLPKRKSKNAIDDDFVPVTWSQVGGQEHVVEEVRKVIEYPILHSEILKKMEYKMPKGFLFYGPPGCGKTLIGKAILSDIIEKLKGEMGEEENGRELEGRFIHVKGPEILNMWLGESERKVREVFQKARDYKEKGQFPFIFIDEAESVLGTRQAWRGHNISNTLVPMFCAEMDGIQSVRDMVVILATNRPDLIDPAILRPGRIDKKIKVSRPNRDDCEAILKVYLKPNLPLEDSLENVTGPFLDKLFARKSEQVALVLTLRSGDFKKLYWKDFISGAILEGIVSRAKETAIERAIKGEDLKIKVDDLTDALRVEFKDNSVLPADSNMEDWLQLLDFDPKHVARVRRPDDSDQATHKTMRRSII
ncbi:MAG: AAA family ATPase [Candidatus Nitronauta litoralis]|uniref:AAA family ATPase n=1 Tax=Candidatus Nitronauta litoralis TaxID=2705533 RepID=A0A7T0BU35_9BACT|nr:MAG: AAA family ATPase [Candidatus Nitronauta litoralis]